MEVDVGDISEEAILAAEAMRDLEQGSSSGGGKKKKNRPQELKDLDAVLEGMPDLFVDPAKQQQQKPKKKKKGTFLKRNGKWGGVGWMLSDASAL